MLLLELFDDTSVEFRLLSDDEIHNIKMLASYVDTVWAFDVAGQTYVFFLEEQGQYQSFSFAKLVKNGTAIQFQETGDGGGGIRVYAAIYQAISNLLKLGMSAIKFSPYTSRQSALYTAMLNRVVKKNPKFEWWETDGGELILAREH